MTPAMPQAVTVHIRIRHLPPPAVAGLTNAINSNEATITSKITTIASKFIAIASKKVTITSLMATTIISTMANAIIRRSVTKPPETRVNGPNGYHISFISTSGHSVFQVISYLCT